MNFRVVTIAGLVALWAVALFAIATLPQTIPVKWEIITLASRIAQPLPPLIATWRANVLAVVGAELMVGFALIEATIVGSSASGQLWQALPFCIGAFSVIVAGTIVTPLVRYWKLSRGSDGA